MTDALAKSISIQVQVRYLTEQSKPADNRFAFAYTITICNEGDRAAQLLDRHWIITDGNGKIQEVRGEGVVGEQPLIQPGACHTYTRSEEHTSALQSRPHLVCRLLLEKK